MSIIKSISGFRGTIGGASGDNLTPIDILNFTTAYAVFIKEKNADIINSNKKIKIIVGRDGRISGDMVKNLVIGSLISVGANVLDLGMATTPTVEIAVTHEKAQGGIIITASHNPAGWNALKFLNENGEFLSAADGRKILEYADKIKDNKDFQYSPENELGFYVFDPMLENTHIQAIVNLPLVDIKLIRDRNLKIVIDGINSIGGAVIPNLLESLGVNKENIILLNCEPNGIFAHKPEPLDENLSAIKELVIKEKADLGIVVDPDVDRLAFIDENGKMFGEEYTLVAISDYVLKNYDALISELGEAGKEYRKATVSNLSSSRALKDITEKYNGTYEASAVGEVNVTDLMKKNKCIIGGEGNGGVIFPPLHYGRDALVGVALFLTALAKSKKRTSELRAEFPNYFMVKDRLELEPGFDFASLVKKIKEEYKNEKINDIDGLKIDWADSWVQLRTSNTEPIMRIYSEAPSLEAAEQKVHDIKDKILGYIK
ncbi:MAG: phosphoglucosamine mutase [Patescibacteria group bacterium]